MQQICIHCPLGDLRHTLFQLFRPKCQKSLLRALSHLTPNFSPKIVGSNFKMCTQSNYLFIQLSHHLYLRLQYQLHHWSPSFYNDHLPNVSLHCSQNYFLKTLVRSISGNMSPLCSCHQPTPCDLVHSLFPHLTSFTQVLPCQALYQSSNMSSPHAFAQATSTL